MRRKPNPGFLTAAAVLNSSASASVFFGCREFVVSPLLIHFATGEQYERQRQRLGKSPVTKDETSTLPAMSWNDLRWNKLLDSGLSGMLTGAALRGFRTGVRAILPGALVVGAATTFLQYGYNELSVMRLRYVSNLHKSTSVEEHASGKTVTQALNDVSEPAFQSLMKLFGVIPLSDEEYLAKLRKSREIYLRRIGELEKQIEAERLTKNPP